jgi:hypothetical protein
MENKRWTDGPLRGNYEPELFKRIDRYAAAFERVFTRGAEKLLP